MRKASDKLQHILADNIRQFRQEKKLSQEALADLCGLHRTYIGSIERCERNVTLSTLEVLAKALAIKPFELLKKNSKKIIFTKSQRIKESGLTIYDAISIGDINYWYSRDELAHLLNHGLKNICVAGLPIRSRSKYIKEKVCQILGYSIPKSFKKIQPRFLGQQFDVYVQKSNNLQIWNEEVSPLRRYVLIKLSGDDFVEAVKVIVGSELAVLDKTGTLTQKFQAKFLLPNKAHQLLSKADSAKIKSFLALCNESPKFLNVSPISNPDSSSLLEISVLYKKLQMIVGMQFSDKGTTQERNRGASLHKIVCKILGYQHYQDSGKFPDIKHQLLEVKLQTATTIDLGCINPESEEYLDISINQQKIRACDIRYAIFYGDIQHGIVTIKHLSLVIGGEFFKNFPQFGGNVINKKIQIPLAKDFFD